MTYTVSSGTLNYTIPYPCKQQLWLSSSGVGVLEFHPVNLGLIPIGTLMSDYIEKLSLFLSVLTAIFQVNLS